MQRMDKSKLVFRRTSGALLEISDDAIQVLIRFQQLRHNQTEAGGMLLGRLIDGTEDMVVDEATIPAPSDKRKRFSFFRGKDNAQRQVVAAWVKSCHTRNYLGEWHSHPEDHPSPSGVDISNWQKIVAKSLFEQDTLVFLIVGRISVRAWELGKNERTPRAMPLASTALESTC
jgi:integrative and conjugative element protein (TIGR02256 family)